MTDKPENPPAFPRTGERFGSPKYDTPGMTLLDYFAGQALAGGFATLRGLDMDDVPSAATEIQALAGTAYLAAHAMLAERAQVQP